MIDARGVNDTLHELLVGGPEHRNPEWSSFRIGLDRQRIVVADAVDEPLQSERERETVK